MRKNKDTMPSLSRCRWGSPHKASGATQEESGDREVSGAKVKGVLHGAGLYLAKSAKLLRRIPGHDRRKNPETKNCEPGGRAGPLDARDIFP